MRRIDFGPRRPRMLAVAVVCLMIAAGCSSSASTPAPTAAPATAAPATAAPATPAPATAAPATAAPATAAPATPAPVSLAGICPDTIVIQADWEPEAEHGAVYNLIGQPANIDTATMRVSGPLMANGQPTGVNIEVRTGGPAVGYTPFTSLMATDPSIFMAWGGLTDAIAAEGTSPLVAVVNLMEKSPMGIYWDPATYPNVKAIKDLQTAAPDGSAVKINVGPSRPFETFLIDNGTILQSQVDNGDPNKPAKFVGAGGTMAEVGFVTAEPYMYEHLIKDWGKPVTTQLLHDVGFREYFMPLYVRASDVTAKADCLKALVPIIQQSVAGCVNDPGPTNDFIVNLVKTYSDGWTYDPGMAAWAAAQEKQLGIVANGADGVVGSFDPARVAELVTFVESTPGSKVAGLDPSTIFTNQFLDTSISVAP